MKKIGFTHSTVDKFVFYRGKTRYTDDSIITGPDQEEIYQIIEDLKRFKLILTVEVDLQNFLWVNI